MGDPVIRVLVVDDHPTFRHGLVATLDAAAGISLAGEAGTGEAALEHCAGDPPDVVLLDLLMPGIGGLETARRLRAEHPDVAVLVLTMSDTDDSMYTALKLGARGYLLKDSAGRDIVEGVRRVAAGQALYDAAVAERIAAYFAHGTTPHPFPELTTREREVLELIARGMDNTAIGRQLVLSPKTVRNVASAVLGKLRVATRAEAVARARSAGLGS